MNLRKTNKTHKIHAIAWIFHFRTTGSTRLNEMGYRPDAIEAQLAHADTNNVRLTYNHATYLEERKVIMQD